MPRPAPYPQNTYYIPETMLTPQSEKEALERCRNGEAQAFAPIVEAYRDRAYRYALSLVRNHHDALDASQEAFVRAFRSLGTYDNTRSFLPWFMRILRNVCLDHIKRHAKFPRSEHDENRKNSLQLVPAPGRNAASKILRTEQIEEIRQALERLSSEHHEILVLRHFQEMTYEQIADVLQIPIGTVMSRLYNARRNLASLLNSGNFSVRE